MRITDCHIHALTGALEVKATLAAMDRNGVDRLVVMSAMERRSLAQTRENVLAVRALCAAAPDRLTPVAWLEPTIPGMGELAREALIEWGFAGLKIIPDHWYAHEERLAPWWALMDELEARILFHTGILWLHEDGSRFCHPVDLEVLVHYPRIRFAMAHISWPWCDECLAVMGRFRAARRDAWQSYIDITPGTPRYCRRQALANALEYCGAERLMWGTDGKLPSDLSSQKIHLERDRATLDELGVSAADQARIFSGTADEFFPSRR